jgi:hypothetical protein
MTTSVWLERERASRETTVAVTASYNRQMHSSKAMKQVETRTNNVPQIYSRSSPPSECGMLWSSSQSSRRKEINKMIGFKKTGTKEWEQQNEDKRCSNAGKH